MHIWLFIVALVDLISTGLIIWDIGKSRIDFIKLVVWLLATNACLTLVILVFYLINYYPIINAGR